jgi:hypothetical protein
MEYEIGKRERTNFLDSRGRAVDGYRVYYEMADGTVDYVEVEKKNFSGDTVRAMIEEEVALHEELMG